MRIKTVEWKKVRYQDQKIDPRDLLDEEVVKEQPEEVSRH